jgi:hypothetical protein
MSEVNCDRVEIGSVRMHSLRAHWSAQAESKCRWAHGLLPTELSFSKRHQPLLLATALLRGAAEMRRRQLQLLQHRCASHV